MFTGGRSVVVVVELVLVVDDTVLVVDVVDIVVVVADVVVTVVVVDDGPGNGLKSVVGIGGSGVLVVVVAVTVYIWSEHSCLASSN